MDKLALTYLKAFGNENILWGHIKFFEEKVVSHSEDKTTDLTLAPHFAVWIRLYAEFISNSLFHSYYRMYLDETIYENRRLGFSTMVTRIASEHEKNPNYLKSKGENLDDVLGLVRKIVELRHCFQHGGLPNFVRELQYTVPENIDELLNPTNFEQTKKLFERAHAFVATLPVQPVGR